MEPGNGTYEKVKQPNDVSRNNSSLLGKEACVVGLNGSFMFLPGVEPGVSYKKAWGPCSHPP
jgi:hypothetical protein